MRNKLQWLSFSANSLKNQALGRISSLTGRVIHKPFYVEFGLSGRCNLRCVHCGQWREHEEAVVSLPEWLELVGSLRSWMGPYQLAIAWGEPFMYEGLLDIISAAAAKGVSTCVVTNGTLVDASMAKKISASGLGRLIFSIDGLAPATHDASRGVPGTFDRVMNGLESVLARKDRPIVNVSTTLHGRNMREIPGLVRMLHAKGGDGIRFQPLYPAGAGWRELWPLDMELLDGVVEELVALKRGGMGIMNSEWVLRSYCDYFRRRAPGVKPPVCKSYMKLIVKHNGDVYLCRQKPPVGNILRDGTPEEIFKSEKGRRALAEIAGCSEPCIMMNCHHFNTLIDRAGEMAQILGR